MPPRTVKHECSGSHGLSVSIYVGPGRFIQINALAIDLVSNGCPSGDHYAFMLRSLLCSLISAFKTHRSLALENLALRQQLAVLQRSVKRPQISDLDRGFWVLLCRFSALVHNSRSRSTIVLYSRIRGSP